MTVRTITNKGMPSNRIDIVILGDGYTSSELATTFTNHANALSQYLFNSGPLTQPFGRYKNFFNVHVIDVESNENGADIGPESIERDTALDSKYFYDGSTERLLYINDSKANQQLNAALAGTAIEADMKFVTVNSDKYGGGGGLYAVYAGGNSSSLEVAVHEVAHSFAHLGDEYGGADGIHVGPEPSEVNITDDPGGQKWSRWLGYEQEGIGTIGAYEGAYYTDTGLYRPSENSKMRSLNNPFDAISREAFVLEFYKYVDPLDSHLYSDFDGLLININQLSLTTIDPELIRVDWFLNGSKINVTSNQISTSDLGINTDGEYTISAKAYDDTDWVRSDRSSLEQTVSWNILKLSAADARLEGSAKNDMINGTADDNVIFADAGNDVVNGAEGIDTASYSGNRQQYTIILNQTDLSSIFDRSGVEGKDTLESVERIDFASGNDVDLEALSGAANLSQAQLSTFIQMYIAYFNRAPDAEGLYYWGNRLDQGMPLQEIAQSFFVQDETLALYPSTVTTTDFVNSVYNNLLGRDADTDGLNYWVGDLESGLYGRDVFLLAAINGANADSGNAIDALYIDNKEKIGSYFAVTKGFSNSSYAKEVMAIFNGSDDSILSAKQAIDQHYQAAINGDQAELLIQLVGVIDNPFAGLG